MEATDGRAVLAAPESARREMTCELAPWRLVGGRMTTLRLDGMCSGQRELKAGPVFPGLTKAKAECGS